MAEAYDKNPIAKIKYTIFIFVPNEVHGMKKKRNSRLKKSECATTPSETEFANIVI